MTYAGSHLLPVVVETRRCTVNLTQKFLPSNSPNKINFHNFFLFFHRSVSILVTGVRGVPCSPAPKVEAFVTKTPYFYQRGVPDMARKKEKKAERKAEEKKEERKMAREKKR